MDREKEREGKKQGREREREGVKREREKQRNEREREMKQNEVILSFQHFFFFLFTHKQLLNCNTRNKGIFHY